ncbi:hypothetical protein rsdtw13_37950 [Clostridium sp. TW13]|uniref:Uncharacterized protein n=1 Tax=Inconstantimicrobium mannanitabidum TaxID=1604901 RepID=A0ACB5RHH5_9CLOT|nr:hypothetical protein rsdtw13_37950 [Clostridium sp. TW13]
MVMGRIENLNNGWKQLLAISKEIVELDNGKIEVLSKVSRRISILLKFKNG